MSPNNGWADVTFTSASVFESVTTAVEGAQECQDRGSRTTTSFTWLRPLVRLKMLREVDVRRCWNLHKISSQLSRFMASPPPLLPCLMIQF